MFWIYLLIAGVFEISWAVGLKYSDGFTKLVPAVFTVATMILSFYFLAKALNGLPLGTAYAVWTGIGAVGTTIFGIILFDEPLQIGRILCIFLIISGIIGLKILS